MQKVIGYMSVLNKDCRFLDRFAAFLIHGHRVRGLGDGMRSMDMVRILILVPSKTRVTDLFLSTAVSELLFIVIYHQSGFCFQLHS